MASYEPSDKDLRRMTLAGELAYAQSIASGATARLSFDDALGEINQRMAALNALAESVARARARGYAWGGDLEQVGTQAQAQAEAAFQGARAESARAAQALRAQVTALERDARRAASGDVLRNEGLINSVAAQARGLDEAITAAKGRVLAGAQSFIGAVDSLGARMKRVHWTLDQFEGASFKMQPEENPLFAAKATWEDHPSGKVEGLLMMTAHRVRFEYQEEVVLERSFVFFASKTEVRRKLLLDALVGHVAGSEASERGMLIKDQVLTLRFAPEAGGPRAVSLELGDDRSGEVRAVIEQVRSGDLERGRYLGAMPEGSRVGVPVKWPEKCETCGAGMQPPVKGQTYLTCEYCRARHDVTLGEG
jgi:hypothetical protein